jgi:hypothetical protein
VSRFLISSSNKFSSSSISCICYDAFYAELIFEAISTSISEGRMPPGLGVDSDIIDYYLFDMGLIAAYA